MNESEEIIIELKAVDVSFYIHNHGMNSIKQFILTLGTKKPFIKSHILKGIDLQIKKGESFGILGRNGAGKSTLLRTIAGIIKPEKGTVRVNGWIAPLLALGVGLEPELTGFENITIMRSIMGMSKFESSDAIASIIDFSGLSEDELNMQVKRFSTGMMARLAFSTAVTSQPEILIIDETLAVGDKGFQEKCMGKIKDLRAAGCTIVMVSHSVAELESICDRAACLKDGTVWKTGKVSEVGEFYHSLFN